MKLTKGLLYSLIIIAMLATAAGSVMAEDGALFRRDISKTPADETEKAGIFMMDFYVPAQASTGLVGPVDNYYLADDDDTCDMQTGEGCETAYVERNYAKPLVSVYIDGPSTHTFYEEEGAAAYIDGGIVFGEMDAFVGVSLDDGTSWKTTNVSQSADLSSFNLKTGEAYPGHVHNVVHQVFDDNILVAWVSKYCQGGTPLYSLTPEIDADETDPSIQLYMEDLEATYGKDAVYLYDLFGVGGDQGSVDYVEQGFYDVGEIPYSCVWTARGKLLAGDDLNTTETVEATHVMWTKPERLTSGVRDANLPVVDCAAGAGCMLTWQEDPEGLRPGQGLGPGEGWSGAVANAQTDIWYSHISQADFDKVFNITEETTTDKFVVGAITMADYDLIVDATMPKAYVPMAIPVRLTDNAKCKGESTELTPSDPYCYIDFDTIDDIVYTNVTTLLALETPEADAEFCTTTIDWTNPGGTTQPVCVAEDGRILYGRVASTRVRMNLKPYTTTLDLDGDGVLDKSAWIVMAAEESKAMGDILIDDGDDATEDDPIDIGKDVWYYSFDPFKTGADEIFVQQGGMLNQPAQCKYDAAEDPLCDGEMGDFYPVQINPLDDSEYYLTEIARRFALTTNSVTAAANSESGLSAMLIYKQGIINQGGPADILLRRVVIPDLETFDPAVDNPYAFENMECAEWLYTDGLNPNYLQGLCLSPAINISGATIVACDGADTDNDTCAATFPMNDDGSNDSDAEFPKVTEWRQCDGTTAIDSCELDNDLDDQTWDNPFDVSKGHRGFLDGDYVMMMYAWSPNWKSNSVGNDHYNLYVRRSFDGGLTWTTTPTDLGGLGVTTTENYCVTISSDECVGTEFTYAAGAFEQGRNVSQLIGNKITILDPRYSPTGGMKLYPTIKTWFIDEYGLNTYGDTLPYPDDGTEILPRDPSKFFMIYETGDNTTVDVGEATPLDLYYSRATIYGDVWELMDYTTDKDDELIDRWPWVENKAEILSGEAAMVVNPGGTFMYAVWNQWEEEITVDEFGVEHELVFNSDMPFRRFLYLPDEVAATTDYIPTVQWLYEGTTFYATETDDTLTLIATGRDFDTMGEGDELSGFEWKMIIVDDEGNELAQRVLEDCTGKICNVKIRTLSEGWDGFGADGGSDYTGWAQITVRSIDNDPAEYNLMKGNYSKQIKVNIHISDYVYRMRLPMIVR